MNDINQDPPFDQETIDNMQRGHANEIDALRTKLAEAEGVETLFLTISKEAQHLRVKLEHAHVLRIEAEDRAHDCAELLKKYDASRAELETMKKRAERAEAGCSIRDAKLRDSGYAVASAVAEAGKLRAEAARDEPSRIDYDQACCEITALKIAAHNCKLAQDRAEKERDLLEAQIKDLKRSERIGGRALTDLGQQVEALARENEALQKNQNYALAELQGVGDELREVRRIKERVLSELTASHRSEMLLVEANRQLRKDLAAERRLLELTRREEPGQQPSKR